MRYVTILVGLALVLGTGCDSKEKSEANAPEKPSAGTESEGAAAEGEGSNEEGSEHPGDEHPGDEHGGDEHAGEEHAGDEADSEGEFSAEEIKTAMNNHIEKKTEKNDGIFQMEDPKSGDKLSLKFVKIHDPVRKIEEKGTYFACTDFHVEGKEDKVYDLDFWLKPKEGELEVTQTKIHKHPVEKDGEWKKEARFTYEDDEPVKVE